MGWDHGEGKGGKVVSRVRDSRGPDKFPRSNGGLCDSRQTRVRPWCHPGLAMMRWDGMGWDGREASACRTREPWDSVAGLGQSASTVQDPRLTTCDGGGERRAKINPESSWGLSTPN